MTILGGLVKTLLPLVPRPLVGRVASRYVAGETLADALETSRRLNAEGASVTLDILGEFVNDAAQAAGFVDEYIELVDAVSAAGLDASVSVKLTMLGLNIDPALCERHLERLCARASEQGIYITLDMEDSSLTDATLEMYRRMRARFGRVGCVLQAYLHRTLDDARALEPSANVRLCKGIYVEPPEIAYKDRREIRDNFMAVLAELVSAGHYVGIATHDEQLIRRAEELLALRAGGRPGVPARQNEAITEGRPTGSAGQTGEPWGETETHYEFQMLLGVRADLRRRLIAAGHGLRVYVPYGRDWYAYSMRRLRENPAVALHVLRAMVGLK